MAQFAHFRFRGIEQESQAAIRKAAALQLPDRIAVQIGQGFLFERELDIDDFLDLRQEPGIDAGQGVDFIKTETLCERSEEHTSELQSLMRISYAVFCLKKNK